MSLRRPSSRTAAALLVLAAAGLLLSPQRAGAHGIETSLERLESLSSSFQQGATTPGSSSTPGALRLESHFSNGEPATDAVVRLVPADGGAPVEVGRTDAAGSLTFSLPATARADWEVQIDAGPGHRDYLELRETGAATVVRHARSLDVHPAALAAAWSPVVGLSLLGCWSLTRRLYRRRS